MYGSPEGPRILRTPADTANGVLQYSLFKATPELRAMTVNDQGEHRVIRFDGVNRTVVSAEEDMESAHETARRLNTETPGYRHYAYGPDGSPIIEIKDQGDRLANFTSFLQIER